MTVHLCGDPEFSALAAWVFFSRALLFWNQIFTLCSVTLSVDDKSRTSEPDRYWVWINLASNAANCEVENGILGFLSNLCRREPFRGFDPGKTWKAMYQLHFKAKKKIDIINRPLVCMTYPGGGGDPLQKGRRCSSENLNLSPKGYQSGSGQSETTSIPERFTLLKERLL